MTPITTFFCEYVLQYFEEVAMRGEREREMYLENGVGFGGESHDVYYFFKKLIFESFASSLDMSQSI